MVNPMIADLDWLYELMDSTHQGSSQLIRDLREELKTEIDKKESEKEVDTVEYWKRKALRLEKSLEESRESRLRLVESLKTMETLKTGECFLSFILENSPFIMGHQVDDYYFFSFQYGTSENLRVINIFLKTFTKFSSHNFGDYAYVKAKFLLGLTQIRPRVRSSVSLVSGSRFTVHVHIQPVS